MAALPLISESVSIERNAGAVGCVCTKRARPRSLVQAGSSLDLGDLMIVAHSRPKPVPQPKMLLPLLLTAHRNLVPVQVRFDIKAKSVEGFWCTYMHVARRTSLSTCSCTFPERLYTSQPAGWFSSDRHQNRHDSRS